MFTELMTLTEEDTKHNVNAVWPHLARYLLEKVDSGKCRCFASLGEEE